MPIFSAVKSVAFRSGAETVLSSQRKNGDGFTGAETLGMAFEPEERFENPDGSDIVFDRDYHGRHRSLSTLPGPFAEGKSEIDLW